MARFLFYTFWLVSTAAVTSQGQTYSILGKITDAATNAPVPFATVYLNGTSWATQSDSLGNFVLTNVAKGDYELAGSSVGYAAAVRRITVTQDLGSIPIALTPQPQTLTEVTVKARRDKKWEAQLKPFLAELLGRDDFAKKCKLINPWVVDFGTSDEKKLIATATQPLIIENRALGYKLHYDLKRFEFAPQSFNLEGLIRFEELRAANPREQRTITESREAAFRGSERHFLRAWVNHRLAQEGFTVFEVDDKYVGNGTVSRLSPQIGNRLHPFRDSLWLMPTLQADETALTLNREIEILNRNEVSYQGTYVDAPHPVSWLILGQKNAICYKNGLLKNQRSVTWAGDIANQRLARLLPTDYEPATPANAAAPLSPYMQQVAEAEVPVATLTTDLVRDSLRVTVNFSALTPSSGQYQLSIVETDDSTSLPVEPLMNATTTADTIPKNDRNALQLTEVQVKARKTVKAKAGSVGYITPDVVVDQKTLQDQVTGNVFTALQSGFPGVRVVEAKDNSGGDLYIIDMRTSRQSSFFRIQPPMILVNGSAFSRNLLELRDIALRDVERIEVFKKPNSLFGIQGANGVINVVTKAQKTNTIAPSLSVRKGYFVYLPPTPFTAKRQVSRHFLLPEPGKKLKILAMGFTATGATFYVEKVVEVR